MSTAFREQASLHDTRPASAGGGMPAPAHLDLADVLRIVGKHWRLFRNVVLSVVVFTLAIVWVLPPTYSTSATVMVEPRRNNITDQTSVLSDMPTDPASIQNQIQLLTSRELAGRVVDRLGLTNDPEFNPALAQHSLNPLRWFGPAPAASGRRRYDAVVTNFLKHLAVQAVGLSTTITVTFRSRDPEKAAAVADAVVEAYLDMQAAIKFDITQRTTDWLLARIRELGLQVQAADAGIQRYKAENDLNDTANGSSVVDQQLAAVNEQLVTARENLAAKEAENARIASLVQAGRAADVSQIVSSPLIVQLREQQATAIRDEAQLATRYGPRHPKRLAAESQKRDLDDKIAEEVNRIAGSVASDVAVARAQVHSLEESLQHIESQSATDNMARVKLRAMEANATSTRSMYEAFVSRLRETQGQDALQMLDARVISHAPVPSVASWPPRLLMAAASLPLGLILGLLVVLIAEKLDAAPLETAPNLRTAAAPLADPFAGRPVLAQLTGAAAPFAANLVNDHPGAPLSHAARALAQRIAASGARVVAVTSLDPRDGQTAVAIALARAAAQLKRRTILVDGNLRAPAVSFHTGLPVAAVGLGDVLNGTARLSQALQPDRSGAFFLCSPQRSANPQATWTSEAMAKLFAHLKQGSDLVVVDAAALAPGSELPAIARLCDALLVVAAGPRPDLATALAHLAAAAPQPTGIVLTG